MSAAIDHDLELLFQSDRPDVPPTVYKPLDELRHEIRVLYLSWQDGNLHLTIEIQSMLDKAELHYEALSYYWGPPNVLETVFLNGIPVKIRESLFVFLQALQSNVQTTPVWLDVLCINQADTHERNWQVSKMGEIYRHAELVRSWLGVGDPDTDFALTYATVRDRISQHAEASEGRLLALNNRAKSCFCSLWNRPYWGRLWIVQEIGLANDIVIHCGQRTISWTDWHNILHDFEFFTEGQNSSGGLQAISDLISLRKDGGYDKLVKTESATLFKRVLQFKNRVCQDPRDKIYGFRSLAWDSDDLEVNYGAPFVHAVLELCCISYESFEIKLDTKLMEHRLNHVIRLTGVVMLASQLLESIDLPIDTYFRQIQPTTRNIRMSIGQALHDDLGQTKRWINQIDDCVDQNFDISFDGIFRWQQTTRSDADSADDVRWELSTYCWLPFTVGEPILLDDQTVQPFKAIQFGNSAHEISIVMRADPDLRLVGVLFPKVHLSMNVLYPDQLLSMDSVDKNEARMVMLVAAIMAGSVQICRAAIVTRSGETIFGLHVNAALVLFLIENEMEITLGSTSIEQAMRDAFVRLRFGDQMLCQCEVSKDNARVIQNHFTESRARIGLHIRKALSEPNPYREESIVKERNMFEAMQQLREYYIAIDCQQGTALMKGLKIVELLETPRVMEQWRVIIDHREEKRRRQEMKKKEAMSQFTSR